VRLPSEAGALRRRAVRDGSLIAGWLVAAWIMVVIPAVGRSLGYDAYSYWFEDLGLRYALAEGGLYTLGAFRYAPPVGLLFSIFAVLPWWLFLWLWMLVSLAAALWLGGRWAIPVLALPPVALEIYHGNVHLLMAAAIVLGFRHAWTWAFVLLTKVTPGVGPLWFGIRREWRSLSIALGATAAVCVVSLVVAPELWGRWLATVGSNAGRTADLSVPPPSARAPRSRDDPGDLGRLHRPILDGRGRLHAGTAQPLAARTRGGLGGAALPDRRERAAQGCRRTRRHARALVPAPLLGRDGSGDGHRSVCGAARGRCTRTGAALGLGGDLGCRGAARPRRLSGRVGPAG